MPLDHDVGDNLLANIVAYGSIFFVGLMLGVLLLVILGGGAMLLVAR